MTDNNKKELKTYNKKFIKLAKYLIIGLLTMYFIINIIGDILSFNRSNKNSILFSKENDIILLVKIKEINPNTGYANIEFNIIEEFFNDSTSKDTISQNFELIIFSGGVMKFSDNSSAFENNSRYHNDFIKFTNSKTIKIGDYIQKKCSFESINIKIDSSPNGYLFPFDKYIIRINFELKDKSGMLRYPTIDTKLEDNKFFVSNAIRNITYGRQSEEIQNSFILFLFRPSYVTMNFTLIVLISLSIVFWSYYRILSNSIVSAFEILGLNFTILFTFPSLRPILIPSNLEYAPLFDISSTILWILSFVAIITYVIKEISLKKKTAN